MTSSSKPAIIHHPLLGPVEIRINDRATRFIARWRNGSVRLTVPRGASCSDIRLALSRLAPRVVASRPEPLYRIGMSIQCPDVTFSIIANPLHSRAITVRHDAPRSHVSILVGSLVDTSTPQASVAISRLLCRVAASLAPELILPRARSIAADLGLKVARWRIGHGLRTLGTCSSRHVITLSYALLFLPSELRDYIVCHELAHLTHLDHSPGFHALCNAYCQGRESVLASQLRSFRWPILR